MLNSHKISSMSVRTRPSTAPFCAPSVPPEGPRAFINAEIANRHFHSIPRKARRGRIEVADLRCIGLTIRVTPNGAKSWSLRFRDPRSGKVTRATIGNYPEITLEKAREKGFDLRREIAEGINPVQRKRKDRRGYSRTFRLSQSDT